MRSCGGTRFKGTILNLLSRIIERSSLCLFMDYLAVGFEPGRLKVAQLRQILLQHSIRYPSNALKPKLVQLFITQLAPQATTLRTIRDNVLPSHHGILDANTNPTFHDLDTSFEQDSPPPTAKHNPQQVRHPHSIPPS